MVLFVCVRVCVCDVKFSGCDSRVFHNDTVFLETVTQDSVSLVDCELTNVAD